MEENDTIITSQDFTLTQGALELEAKGNSIKFVE
jgi:hypothetical protein